MQAQSTIDVQATASENIEMAFLSQISLKHMELESINKEIGKCQAALEQLRRCHLIPYPVNAPTPAQMLDVVQGKGHALQQPGQPVPRYAPPFGVIDGPYARHYAKWLIPHSHFDGIQYEERGAMHGYYTLGLEGRSTRNSGVEASKTVRGRASRGEPPAFQSLAPERPQPKAKAGPCLITRSDGVMVKLQCVDCERDNFNSVQGFINHCRIAHKREFKSHDEAAIKSGQPWDSAQEAAGAGKEPVLPKSSRNVPKEAPKAPAPTGVVHPLTGAHMSNSEACASLLSRIESVMSLWEQGQHADQAKAKRVSTKPRAEAEMPASFEPSQETPHLSKLMRSRKFAGSLHDIVNEIKTPLSLEDITPSDESEDELSSAGKDVDTDTPAVVKRLPVGSSKSPSMSAARPASSKGVTPGRSRIPAPRSRLDQEAVSEEDVDMETNLSPTTLVPNSAPSLVSDDGEYDDSEDASSVSGHSEGLDAESVSDVADINIEEDHEPRNIRRTSTGVSNAVRLRREDPKHVSIVSPMANNRTTRSKRKA